MIKDSELSKVTGATVGTRIDGDILRYEKDSSKRWLIIWNGQPYAVLEYIEDGYYFAETDSLNWSANDLAELYQVLSKLNEQETK
jgi:hypothetical protein